MVKLTILLMIIQFNSTKNVNRYFKNPISYGYQPIWNKQTHHQKYKK